MGQLLSQKKKKKVAKFEIGHPTNFKHEVHMDHDSATAQLNSSSLDIEAVFRQMIEKNKTSDPNSTVITASGSEQNNSEIEKADNTTNPDENTDREKTAEIADNDLKAVAEAFTFTGVETHEIISQANSSKSNKKLYDSVPVAAVGDSAVDNTEALLPTSEQSAVTECTTEKLGDDQLEIQQPITEQSAVTEFTDAQPADEQLAIEQPITEQSVVTEYTAEAPTDEQSTIEQPIIEKSTLEELTKTEQATETSLNVTSSDVMEDSPDFQPSASVAFDQVSEDSLDMNEMDLIRELENAGDHEPADHQNEQEDETHSSSTTEKTHGIKEIPSEQMKELHEVVQSVDETSVTSAENEENPASD